jgi:hypothetical protein
MPGKRAVWPPAEERAMDNFIMLILTTLPPATPAPPPHDRSVFLTPQGCEEAAARTPMPPGLRLVCVPVNGEPAVLSAMH